MTDHDSTKDFGDDQGTRVGSPTPRPAKQGDGDPASRKATEKHTGKPTGAGAEAAEGIHAADGDRDATDRTALDGKVTGRGNDDGVKRSGSEPQTSHDIERRSGYGGAGGDPVTY